jgi:hypothetical protein
VDYKAGMDRLLRYVDFVDRNRALDRAGELASTDIEAEQPCIRQKISVPAPLGAHPDFSAQRSHVCDQRNIKGGQLSGVRVEPAQGTGIGIGRKPQVSLDDKETHSVRDRDHLLVIARSEIQPRDNHGLGRPLVTYPNGIA